MSVSVFVLLGRTNGMGGGGEGKGRGKGVLLDCPVAQLLPKTAGFFVCVDLTCNCEY